MTFLAAQCGDVSGFTVLERFRARHPDAMPKMNVVLLSFAQRNRDIARCYEFGNVAYLVKPFRYSELFRTLHVAQTGRRALPAPSSTGVATPTLGAIKILLVEDFEDNQMLIKAFLKNTPCEIDVADNGAIGFQKFKDTRYDIVLMDVQMPVMDGLQATRAIREWEQDQHRPMTPIIALTAHAFAEDQEKTLAAGCTSHLTKPIKKAVLLTALSETVSTHTEPSRPSPSSA